MTQGFVQGAKLKMMREEQQREQEAADRIKAQDSARASAYQKLGQDQQNWNGGLGIGPQEPAVQGPPAEYASHTGPIAPAPSQDQPIGPQIPVQGPEVPTEQGPQLPPDAIAAGAMKSSMPLGQALDYQNLRAHQKALWAQLLPEMGRMNPQEAALFKQTVLEGFAKDAELLDRSHAVSEAHDFIVNGGLDVLDGAGNPIRDPALVKQVMDLAQQAEQGAVPPSVLRAKLEQYGDLAHASYIETHQRLARADQAKAEIQEIISNGGWAPESAVSAERRFRIGKYDKKQFEEDWPHLIKDEVKYNGDWYDRGTAEQMKKADIEKSKYELEVAQLKKQLAEFQKNRAPADADRAAKIDEAKSLNETAQSELYKAQAKNLGTQADRDILDAMVTQTKAELAEGKPASYSKQDFDAVIGRIQGEGGAQAPRGTPPPATTPPPADTSGAGGSGVSNSQMASDSALYHQFTQEHGREPTVAEFSSLLASQPPPAEPKPARSMKEKLAEAHKVLDAEDAAKAAKKAEQKKLEDEVMSYGKSNKPLDLKSYEDRMAKMKAEREAKQAERDAEASKAEEADKAKKDAKKKYAEAMSDWYKSGRKGPRPTKPD